MEPARSKEEWKQYALSRLGYQGTEKLDSTKLQTVQDQSEQTIFGEMVDNQAATIVTTADIGELIPIPDSATLLRSTKESLKRCESEATELLRQIQRDLQLQLQEAGVSYKPTTQDTLSKQGTRGTQFADRRQLSYQTAPPTVEPPKKNEYWKFAEGKDHFNMYNPNMVKRAVVMESLQSSSLARHKQFDEIEKSLQESQAALAMAQAAAQQYKEEKDGDKELQQRYKLPQELLAEMTQHQ